MVAQINWIQMFVIVAGFTILVICECFPPWYYKDRDTSANRSAGYHFYQETPPKASEQDLRKLFNVSPNEYFVVDHVTLQLDKGRRGLQRLFIASLAVGLFLLHSGRNSKWERVVGRLTLAAAVVFLFLLGLRFMMFI